MAGVLRPSSFAALASGAVLDLVLPQDCASCAGGGGPLCGACHALLPRSGWCARPPGNPPGLPVVVAAGAYDGVLRAALLAHKDGATGLAGPLGAVLAGAVLATLATGRLPSGGLSSGAPVLLVPAPSAPRVVRQRGHDHALRLARAAARHLRRCGVRAEALAGLRQHRTVDDQGTLSAGRRAANLRGAVVARRRTETRLTAVRRARGTLLLVDDVCASGATLAECARALAATGHAPAAAVVAAATVLRSG